MSRSPSGPVAGSTCRLLRATSQEAALIAAELRKAHLLDGVPWSQMAVIVRGQGRTSSLRRVLMSSGVPVAVPSSEVPVRDEMAVRPLLSLLDVVLRSALGEPSPIDPEAAVDAVLSPIGGADTVGLRRLRRALRREELDAGGGRTSDELLVAGIVNPDFLANVGPEAAPARRVARAIAAGVEAARTVDEDGALRWAPGVTAETVLWAMWEATGLADLARPSRWAAASRGRAPTVTSTPSWRCSTRPRAMSTACPRWARGGSSSTSAARTCPATRSSARAPSDDTVSLLTPQGAAGRTWSFVVVAGVQEGVWPDLRLRGSLLGSERLVDVRHRPRPVPAGGPGGRPLRRDPAVPRRGQPGQRAAARDGRAQ